MRRRAATRRRTASPCPEVDQVPVRYRIIPSPIGDLVAWGDGDKLAGLGFTDSSKATSVGTTSERDDAAFEDVVRRMLNTPPSPHTPKVKKKAAKRASK